MIKSTVKGKSKPKPKKRRGILFNGVLEKIPAKYFAVVGKQLRTILNRKPGIYALYKDEKLYYVGLASNAFGRIKTHSRGSNKRKWDKFSIFLVKNAKYLKDIETSIIRIAKPKGNTQKGKIYEHNTLKTVLRNSIKEKKKQLGTKLRKRNLELKKVEDEIELVEEALSKGKK